MTEATPLHACSRPPGADGHQPLLEVEGLRKSYGRELVLDDVTLSVLEGELVSIVGPSGCGKTTMLRCLAGLLPYDAGSVKVASDLVTGPHDTLGVVFQDYSRSLPPWLSVEENTRLPLRYKGFCVLAEVCGLAAWLVADRGDNVIARRRYTEAVHHAERAHHPLLASYMTASLGHFAVESGDPRQGVMLIDRAGAQLDQAAPSSARAWLASLSAVAHAALGDHQATYAALRTAERAASRQRGEPAWPWVFSFDRAKVVRYQAGALARLGDLSAATAAFEGLPPVFSGPKPRAMMQLEQAQVLAGRGHVEDGCALALDALRIGRDYGSERITSRVRAFRGSLPTRTSTAATLDEALTARYEDQD